MDGEQIDFFDVLFPKRRHQLCPALEKWQDNYDATIEGNMDTLCKSWREAKRNKVGVFTTYTKYFVVGGGKREYMELHLALAGEHIYGVLNAQVMTPNYYGRQSPLTENAMIRLSVTDGAEFARTHLSYSIRNIIEFDKNLSKQNKENMYQMIDQLVDNAVKDMAK